MSDEANVGLPQQSPVRQKEEVREKLTEALSGIRSVQEAFGVSFPTEEETPLSIKQKIYEEVRTRNLPRVLALALIANAGGESLTVPNARQKKKEELSDAEYLELDKGGHAFGLFQFDGGQGKKVTFKRWADRNGLDYGSDSQIKFVLDDLEGKLDSGRGIVEGGTTMGFGNRANFMKVLPSLEENPARAVALVAQEYERAGTVNPDQKTATEISDEIDRRVKFLPDANELRSIESNRPIPIMGADERLEASERHIVNNVGQIIDSIPYAGTSALPMPKPERNQ
jgi:hypothetical protein